MSIAIHYEAVSILIETEFYGDLSGYVHDLAHQRDILLADIVERVDMLSRNN